MSAVRPAKRQVFRLSKERRVADIMDAAIQVFRERGYDEAPLSEIAERASVVEGSIYRYFDNKRDLLIKVIEHWYEGMLADYDQQLSGIAGTRNRLRYMIWRHLATIHEEPALCNVMFQFLRSGADYQQTAVHDLNRAYTRKTIDIIMQGIADGELRGDISLRLVRDMIYGCVEHRTFAYLRGEGDFDPEQTADDVVELVLNGLSVPNRPFAQTNDLAGRIEHAVQELEELTERLRR